MNSSKTFIPKQASTSPLRRSNAKIWGQRNQRPDLDRDNIQQPNKFKSFTTDKDKISKIFAPKLTVINNNISIGSKQEINLEKNVSVNWKNPNCNFKQNIKNPNYEKPLEVQNSSQVDESYLGENAPQNDKQINFWSALIPKIKIGKYTFGGVKNKKPYLDTSKKDKFSSNNEESINKIFSNEKYNPEAIFNKLNSTKKPKATFFQHIKTSSSSAAANWWDSIKFDFYDKPWFRKLNYQFVAFDVVKNFNRLIIGICILGLIGFFTYLSFFDQYFAIKKYTVEYVAGSYLNNQQTFDLIKHFQKNKLYKVFPNNQYWFANNLSLTASAKEIFPEVKNVNVKNRQWPDRVTLQVETNKPILTLWVTENNEQKYWRINENGKISSQDKAALWYNLVKVEKPYTIQGDPNQKLSLFNHSFENDPSQKQRFKLTKKLIDYFKSVEIDINSIIFPSISDTDIVMESTKGTKFLFDSLAFENDLQVERLDYFLKFRNDKNDFYELHKQGEFAYFDFRIQYKVFSCKINENCNVKPENINESK